MSDKWLYIAIIATCLIAVGTLGVITDRNMTRFDAECEADGGISIHARNGMFCIKDRR